MNQPGFIRRFPTPAGGWRRLGLALGLVFAAGLTAVVITRASSSNGGQTIRLGDPGAVQDPTIGTNREVEGDALPDVAVEAISGATIRTGSFVGRPLVINFWYSACPPCKRELPDLAAVSDELADQVRFVGINPVDDADATTAFATEHGVTYDNFLDPTGTLLAALGINVFPTTLFVRPDGTIAGHGGSMTADQLSAAIKQNLAEP